MTVAAALVTHDAERWLSATLQSIREQSVPVDQIVVVDDRSSDRTIEILAEFGIRPIQATTLATDAVSRIAANFAQAAEACSAHDLVALGDHDDVWHPDRIAIQSECMAGPAIMVASDGRIVDEDGEPSGGTLRESFSVPSDWSSWDAPSRVRFALRHSIATGGASMIRPSGFPRLQVPGGWLHDRWWSLVATVREGMLIDDQVVIDYRVQAGQQVGLDLAAQGRSGFGRVAALAGQTKRSLGKQRDLRKLLRPLALSPEVKAAVSLRDVM